jgi:hypothetical protein
LGDVFRRGGAEEGFGHDFSSVEGAWVRLGA